MANPHAELQLSPFVSSAKINRFSSSCGRQRVGSRSATWPRAASYERMTYLPAPEEMEQLFAQKYGSSGDLGWAPRRRRRFGYYLPSDYYEALVSKLVIPGCRWIDVGGGHDIFPENPSLARSLAARCSTVVAVDPSDNVHRNSFVHKRAQCLIEDYRAERHFDLATLRMVVEHVERPSIVIDALNRLLMP